MIVSLHEKEVQDKIEEEVRADKIRQLKAENSVHKKQAIIKRIL